MVLRSLLHGRGYQPLTREPHICLCRLTFTGGRFVGAATSALLTSHFRRTRAASRAAPRSARATYTLSPPSTYSSSLRRSPTGEWEAARGSRLRKVRLQTSNKLSPACGLHHDDCIRHVATSGIGIANRDTMAQMMAKEVAGGRNTNPAPIIAVLSPTSYLMHMSYFIVTARAPPFLPVPGLLPQHCPHAPWYRTVTTYPEKRRSLLYSSSATRPILHIAKKPKCTRLHSSMTSVMTTQANHITRDAFFTLVSGRTLPYADATVRVTLRRTLNPHCFNPKPSLASHQYLVHSLAMPIQFRGKYLLTHPTREDAITCVAFSIHGDFIAIGGLDRKLHIFSLANGQLHYSIVSPSHIKSLIWLPGTEQTLVCACYSGILMNIVVRPGDSINLSCFRAQHHAIEFMAADASTGYLSTGSGSDVQIWKGGKRHDWKGHGILGVPKKSADNCDAEIILTGLHWHSGSSAGGGIRVITTYRHHGIQLWDVEKMTVIQSINMPSPMLGSSLSPNGLHISAAKRGGYDMYSLDSGIVLHTFAHGLPLDADVRPSTFLPRGVAFCGATVDGTVTLWDVKVGDRLQSVQHLRASMPSILPSIGAHPPEAGATLHAVAVHTEEKSGIMLLATASQNEVRVWHAISDKGSNRHSRYDGQRFAKPDTIVAAWAITICAIAVLLTWVFQVVI
ncbi:WD40-repeat-containing domain protein [Lactarius indigo]|nr:WD40-repeat-containing domain protein [Lactarius indigo]